MSQVKFLSGLKSQLAAKQGSSELVVGALYFCTDEKKIFKATANNAYEAVNEEVYFGELPEPASAFPGKLYLKQSDMTLHVLNGAKNGFKQLSAPADALVPGDVSENLNAEDGLLLASKAAVKAAVQAVAGDLATEIANRGTAETQLLVDAKKYADDQDANLKTVLQKEIDDDVKVEKERAEAVEQGLADRLDTIEGGDTVVGSIKAAVKAEKDRAEGEEARIEGLIGAEKSRAEAAEVALENSIKALAGDGEGSVAEQVGKVQEELDKFKNDVVGSPAEVDPENGTVTKEATGLFGKIDEEITRAKGEEARIEGLLTAEVTRAKAAEQANAKAIADEASAREEADEALQDAIDKLNGTADVEGSVAKAVKDAVDTEVAAREGADAGLQAAINDINEALGLGTGATGSVGARLNTLESEMDAVEGRASALEAAVGAKAGADPETQPATGLYKEVDDLKAKDASLQAAINTLNGGADVEGSVAKAVADEAKLRKDADDALDGRLDIIEASIGTGGDLEKRVKKNEDDIKVINGEGEGSIKKAVADLVNGAPEAMNTLNELAQAIDAHQGVYEGYVQTVSNNIADAKQEAKNYADEQDEALHTTISTEIDADVEAEANRAKGIEAGLRTDVNSKVAQSAYDTKVAALEKADTDNLAAAKKYADELAGNYNTATEGEESNASGLRKEIEERIASEKAERVAADGELQGAIDDINAALGLGGGAAGSVGDRLSNLETAVGAPAVEGDPGTPASGLYGEVDALKAADIALDGRLDDLESVVGDAGSGLVKDVAENAAAIEIINGGEDQEGSIAKALKEAKEDATTKADAAKDAAIAAAETKDTALKAEIEKADGVLMTAIKAEETRADGVEKGLDTRLKTVEASIGKDGALETRVANVEAKAEANKVAIGDENSGLTKGVADNAAAIAAINNEDNGILAQAKADATTKANAAQVAAEAEAARLDGLLRTELQGYANDAEADALASAQEYVDEKIGTASVPDGDAASGLHKVIEDGDTTTLAGAKDYADTAVTGALTWGSF